jgi:hypothetical protein
VNTFTHECDKNGIKHHMASIFTQFLDFELAFYNKFEITHSKDCACYHSYIPTYELNRIKSHR